MVQREGIELAWIGNFPAVARIFFSTKTDLQRDHSRLTGFWINKTAGTQLIHGNGTIR